MKYKFVLFVFIIFFYTLPRYYWFLPTLPVYKNSEADKVLLLSKERTDQDVQFFKLTDLTISTAFVSHVPESLEQLDAIITEPHVLLFIVFFKCIINRPRPYQINKDIPALDSKTGNTPALPAGHAFQAYYLADILGKRYPNKSGLFLEIAKKCDETRVKAGIHYPSDGALSKSLAKWLR